jgi:flagellar hook-basal body complex protein FliE
VRTTLGQALAAYTSAAAHGRPRPAPAEPAATAPSFAGLVREGLAAAVGSLERSEATVVAGLTGKASVQQVVEAVSTAELSLQKVTAVRDRVIAAYQEIARMPV